MKTALGGTLGVVLPARMGDSARGALYSTATAGQRPGRCPAIWCPLLGLQAPSRAGPRCRLVQLINTFPSAGVCL